MKIAIVGTGISGMLAARRLAQDQDQHVFEANNYVGGHTNSVAFKTFGSRYAVDTGFMVFNDRSYPNFGRMLRLLGISGRWSDMSFSVRCSKSGLECQGSSLNSLLAQRRNLFRPSFRRMILDILRFNRSARELLREQDDSLEIGEYLARGHMVRAPKAGAPYFSGNGAGLVAQQRTYECGSALLPAAWDRFLEMSFLDGVIMGEFRRHSASLFTLVEWAL